MIRPTYKPSQGVVIVAIIALFCSASLFFGISRPRGVHGSSGSTFARPSLAPPPVTQPTTSPDRPHNPESADPQHVAEPILRQDKLHVLLPASNPEVNLCKTLMTGAILGYPTPHLIAWNQTFEQGHLLGGGSHVAKVSGVLEYLNAMDASADEELVLMMDAYDIWFQLPPEVLIDRYYSINAAANRRLKKRLGSAVKAEDLRQTIIFGAGKRCAPNQLHTVACYPIPASPLPDDLYGANTDTVLGRNKYTSLKQRYLNSGYIIGPARDMRKMFQRAWEKVQATKDQMDWDNGSHGSDFMYHGSDQSIFNSMLGEQEFQREVMRRRHRSKADQVLGIGGPPKATRMEGTTIKDPLNPGFTHEPMDEKHGKPDEFSMGLDYFSELGQQTVNAEEDARFIVHDQNIEHQIGERHLFDCPSRVTPELPVDIVHGRKPALRNSDDSAASEWSEVPLYTNICLNTIPVMVHHNGDKGAREYAWPQLWMQPQARKLLANVREQNDEMATAGGAFSEGELQAWETLCPTDMDAELYRDTS